MEPFFNPLLNSGVSVASAHETARHEVQNEAMVVVSGRVAAAILIPNLQDATTKLGKNTITRLVIVVNRSTEPATVSVSGGGTIDGARAVTLDPGKTGVFAGIPDPTSAGVNTLEYGLLVASGG